MRIKDENKQEAIIKATVKLVNQIGFAACSVSKIAKEAEVSPATLYIYYKNKEEMIVSTYIDIKKKLSSALLKNLDTTLPLRDICRNIWVNGFDYISRHQEYFQFAEQFGNSPYTELVDHSELDKHFAPIIALLNKGIEQKIIKNVPFEMLTVFIFYPVMLLSNPRLCRTIKMSKANVDTAFTMAWDAIKY